MLEHVLGVVFQFNILDLDFVFIVRASQKIIKMLKY